MTEDLFKGWEGVRLDIELLSGTRLQGIVGRFNEDDVGIVTLYDSQDDIEAGDKPPMFVTIAHISTVEVTQ